MGAEPKTSCGIMRQALRGGGTCGLPISDDMDCPFVAPICALLEAHPAGARMLEVVKLAKDARHRCLQRAARTSGPVCPLCPWGPCCEAVQNLNVEEDKVKS